MTEKAILIRWMAFGLLAATVINVIVLYFAADPVLLGIDEALFGPFRPIDLAEQFLIFVSGICLLKQHKLRWLLAIVFIFTAVGLNLYSVMDSSHASNYLSDISQVKFIFSLVLAVSLVIILYYSRYPYLDRRQGWFGQNAQRFDIKERVLILAEETQHYGETINLSLTGCRLKLQSPFQFKNEERFVDIQFPRLKGVTIKAQFISQGPEELRLKFREFAAGSKSSFAEWINALAADKDAEEIKFSSGLSEKS